MLDKDVVMPSPKGHAVGREAVIALFRENPSYKEGIVSWSPVAPSWRSITPAAPLVKLVWPVIVAIPSSAKILPLLVNAPVGAVKVPAARSIVPLLVSEVKPAMSLR